MSKFCLFIVALLFSLDGYSKVEECGKAKKVEGDKCSSTKVVFDLTGCEDGITEVEAKVDCSKNDMSASYKTSKFTYKLQLAKEVVWAREQIVSSGKILRTQRKEDSQAKNSEVKIIKKVEDKEETPSKFSYNLSGSMAIEFERTEAFGFDGDSGIDNFQKIRMVVMIKII